MNFGLGLRTFGSEPGFQDYGFDVLPLRMRLIEMGQTMIQKEQSEIHIFMLKERAEKFNRRVMGLKSKVEESKMNSRLALNEARELEKTFPDCDGAMALSLVSPS